LICSGSCAWRGLACWCVLGYQVRYVRGLDRISLMPALQLLWDRMEPSGTQTTPVLVTDSIPFHTMLFHALAVCMDVQASLGASYCGALGSPGAILCGLHGSMTCVCGSECVSVSASPAGLLARWLVRRLDLTYCRLDLNYCRLDLTYCRLDLLSCCPVVLSPGYLDSVWQDPLPNTPAHRVIMQVGHICMLVHRPMGEVVWDVSCRIGDSH
jgi:hypothetical protein